MLSARKFNFYKKKLVGTTFHLFIMDSVNAAVYDELMDEPIIHGTPGVIGGMIKNLKNKNNPFIPLEQSTVTFYVYHRNPSGFFIRKHWPQTENVKVSAILFPNSP